MQIISLSEFDEYKGWFIGNFEPSLFKTKKLEIGIKKYQAGDVEKPHLHKIATEYTIVLSGTILMNNNPCGKGTVIEIAPNEKCNFSAVTDAETLVIKIPSVIGDKYEC